MAEVLTINLDSPLISAQIPPGAAAHNSELHAHNSNEELLAELEAKKAEMTNTIQNLQQIIDRLTSCSSRMITEHREAIAKLAVEIARRVLVRKVSDKDYEIESIIKEVLNRSPSRQDMVVRMNPDDISEIQKVQGQDANNIFAGVRFVPDANIGRAECVLETAKGHIESLIDEHLEQITRALTKAV